MRVSFRWVSMLSIAVATAWVTSGCGDGGYESGIDKTGKTHVSGEVKASGVMAIALVPIVDGKPDESKGREGGTVLEGKYNAWVPPGKYQLQAIGAGGKGRKVTDLNVGTEPITFDVTELPAERK